MAQIVIGLGVAAVGGVMLYFGVGNDVGIIPLITGFVIAGGNPL